MAWKKGVMTAAHPHTPFLGQCPPGALHRTPKLKKKRSSNREVFEILTDHCTILWKGIVTTYMHLCAVLCGFLIANNSTVLCWHIKQLVTCKRLIACANWEMCNNAYFFYFLQWQFGSEASSLEIIIVECLLVWEKLKNYIKHG